MQKVPEVYLRHILDEIIGEAASNIDETYRGAHPEIPWKHMIAFRNRLVHGYMGINYNIVVHVLQNEISTLRSKIESLLSDQ